MLVINIIKIIKNGVMIFSVCIILLKFNSNVI